MAKDGELSCHAASDESSTNCRSVQLKLLLRHVIAASTLCFPAVRDCSGTVDAGGFALWFDWKGI